MYDHEIHQKISKTDYQRLNTKVKRSIDQKLRLRNFDAGYERIETGAVVTNHRGQRGVDRGPGECYQWKAKGQCSRGDSCSFRHDENKRAKSTPKSAPPSEPPIAKDGGSTSRRKSLRGRSPSGKLSSAAVQRWHQRYVHETILWLLASSRKWIPQKNSGSKFGNKPAKNRKRMVTKVQWLYWRMHDNCVAYFRTSSRRNLHRFYGRAQKSWDHSDECSFQKPHCVTQTSEKVKVHRLEWFNSKILTSAVRTLQNLRIGVRKRLRTRAMRPRRYVENSQKSPKTWKKRTKHLFSHLPKFGSQHHP